MKRRQPVVLVAPDDPFPPPEQADASGLVALARGLAPERLVAAYTSGIFPWGTEQGWTFWYSPDPRLVLRPARLHVGHRLARTIRAARFRVTLDEAFAEVIGGCAAVPRAGQPGTWITHDFVAAYTELHQRGLAHSVETWSGSRLAGGLYGVSLGAAFFGESMFARETDASKVAFVALVEQLHRWGFALVDCQVHTAHLARFGAENWRRTRFLRELARALAAPTREGRWRFDAPAPHEQERGRPRRHRASHRP